MRRVWRELAELCACAGVDVTSSRYLRKRVLASLPLLLSPHTDTTLSLLLS